MAENSREYKLPSVFKGSGKLIIKGELGNGFIILFMKEDMSEVLYSFKWENEMITEDSCFENSSDLDGCVGLEFMFDENQIYKYAIYSSGEKSELPVYDLNFPLEDMSSFVIEGNLTVNSLEFQYN